MDVSDHDKKKGAAVVRAKKVEKVPPDSRQVESAKYVAKKLADKGIIRMDRHPSDGTGIGQPPPKSGHGGKYTWEGPVDLVESELSPVPPAIDERDPNYVDEKEKLEEEQEYVIGEVEVAKEAETGVARIDVDPKLKADLVL
ncbi:hypothetical protein MLD38_035453 [Melastoma candidum]|uniref:Uncharacterized protein n=1 Tax=Melastoma candidum TaxID=119954 RepID=A0ACB9LH27_9MYRT|nr:hypothetical protein MLD38_035453 [Melastoma candidum]